MARQHIPGGIFLDRTDLHGRGATIPSRLSADPLPLFLSHAGDNSAGNGGNGNFAGSLVDHSYATFEPFNAAEAGANAAADAYQANIVNVDQAATQVAGVGGDGGNQNAALGGTVGVHGSIGSEAVATGGNAAGNGGDGHFAGAMIDASAAVFDPTNIGVAGFHAAAGASQSNTVHFDQSAAQVAGVGGHGGSGNLAIGGDISLFETSHGLGHHWGGSNVIATGGNSAGDGGEGYFSGSVVHESVALYDPINIAIAGANSSAQAVQTNNVDLNQSAFQMAGVGGHGGDGNTASGGNVAIFSSDLGSFGSNVLATGGNSAGNGGEGYFSGSIVHESVALYDPINIAVAGANSSAEADQVNNVDFNQSAFQMAGVGGHGGGGNIVSGGSLGVVSSDFGLFGSDVIATGGNSAGDGGNGHFSGALVDVNIAIYAPINIAVAGYNSSAIADQTNTVHLDQSATQISGIGGDGGHGNFALGGDFTMQFLADHHLLGHPA